jgi:DNA repair exonuclease SbcCD ATPase subunit
MQIQRIKIENFKSIYEPFEIDFNNIKGLWKISGSVGSGKTTIGEAIIYGLFGTVNGKNNGDLISWGRKKGFVEIWCVSKGRNIYIKRELKSYGQSPLYVEVDGEEIVFTNKRDAQQQLEQEYYDTSKVMLELLCIISFNNFKSLATLNASDTKKFLDQTLGFYTLTEYAEACKELKLENLTNISRLNNLISQLESQVEKLEELSNVEIIEGNMDGVKSQIDEFETEYKEVSNKYNDEQKLLETEKVNLCQKRASIVTLGNNKKREIEFIEKGICPTCGAPIDQSQLEIKKQEKDLLTKSYLEIQEKIKAIDDQISTLNLEKTHETNSIWRTITSLKQLLTRLEEQAKRLGLNKGEIDSIRLKIAEYDKDRVKYQTEDAQWEQLYDILSHQIRAEILQSFIPALNLNILKYTQRLHLPYIVQFDSNFKCNIRLCGIDKDIPVSSLSTGQLKTVDMVIILGVLGTVIGSNGINIMFLDELFSNLDAGLRNEMCQVLREIVSEDMTIFIISHTDLENRYFDGNIHLKLEIKDQYEKHSTSRIEKFVNNEGNH